MPGRGETAETHFFRLGEQVVNHPGFEDRGQLLVQPVVFEEQLLVMHPQQVQQRGVEVGDTDPVLDRSYPSSSVAP